MKKDSGNKTGKNIIGSIGKDVLIEFYTSDEIKEDYMELRRRLRDPKLANRDFSVMLKLLWDFTITKPVKLVDASTQGEKLTAGIFVGSLDEND